MEVKGLVSHCRCQCAPSGGSGDRPVEWLVEVNAVEGPSEMADQGGPVKAISAGVEKHTYDLRLPPTFRKKRCALLGRLGGGVTCEGLFGVLFWNTLVCRNKGTNKQNE